MFVVVPSPMTFTENRFAPVTLAELAWALSPRVLPTQDETKLDQLERQGGAQLTFLASLFDLIAHLAVDKSPSFFSELLDMGLHLVLWLMLVQHFRSSFINSPFPRI